jgi:tetratricopeptide (TPR) repeat protein
MKIFLSAVSGQFRECRNALASDLRAVGVEVAVQEDFQQHGRTLLEKLQEYIAGCDRMIALVGNAYGSEPEPAVRPAGRPRRSYTQWEYFFAQGERLDGTIAPRDDIYVYVATADYLKAHPVQQTADQAELQRGFLAEICTSGEDRNAFDSLDQLCRLALRDGFRVHDPDVKPCNLRLPSIGSLFKGRDDFLDDLWARLGVPGAGARPTAIVNRLAVHGLGGVGKTRAALEYAWRHERDYTALLFVSAPSAGEFHTNLANLVGVLRMAFEKASTDEQMAHVLDWLDAHPGWLLIVDNVDTEEAAAEVQRLLPRLRAGHVLITSRIGNWPPGVEPLDLDVLAPDAAVVFLLERTPHRRSADDDAAQAAQVARELGGLALGLEQAGAYIDKLRLSFAEYLQRWQTERPEVLRWHDERLMQYPASVAVTWETTLAQLTGPERRLLDVLAWLAPEPIPMSLFDAAPMAEAIGDPREALAGLTGYSLARFDATGEAVLVHRLVQEITRSRIPAAVRPATVRIALDAVDALAPYNADDVRTWGVWAALAAHAGAVSRSGDAAGVAQPTARLMNQLGLYLYSRGQFGAAEPLLRRALAIDEQSYGRDHPNVALALNNLAGLLWATNRPGEAEPLLRRALDIAERSYGPDHPNVAPALNNLAELLRATNRSGEAEPLYCRALDIYEHSDGPDHPAVALTLNNLAGLLQATNRPGEAEPLLRRALDIAERSCGPDHPNVALALNNLAELLRATNHPGEAEPLFRRALDIYEHSYGHDHPHVAIALNNLGLMLRATNRPGEAEPLCRRALDIAERSYGPDHPHVALALYNLALLLGTTNRLSEAEPLLRRGLEIFLKFTTTTGYEHLYLRRAMESYERLLKVMGSDPEQIRARLDEILRPFGLSLGGSWQGEESESRPTRWPLVGNARSVTERDEGRVQLGPEVNDRCRIRRFLARILRR